MCRCHMKNQNKRRCGDDGHVNGGPPWPFGQDTELQELSSNIVSSTRISLFACENSNKMVFTLNVYTAVCVCLLARSIVIVIDAVIVVIFDEKFVTLFCCVCFRFVLTLNIRKAARCMLHAVPIRRHLCFG